MSPHSALNRLNHVVLANLSASCRLPRLVSQRKVEERRITFHSFPTAP